MGIRTEPVTFLSPFYTLFMDWTFTIDWQIFALSQMGLLAVGICTAFYLHSRTLKTQNAQLRQRTAQLESKPPAQKTDNDPAALRVWMREHLETLPQDDRAYAVIKAVLRNAIQPKETFLAQFPEIVAKAGFESVVGEIGPEGEAAQERIHQLESELTASENSASLNNTQAAELKTLLQQFTHDSREMMACIQHLERENLALRNGLESRGLPLPELLESPDALGPSEVESAA